MAKERLTTSGVAIKYGEDRFLLLGMDSGQELLLVVYTEREERICIISARRATQREQDHYYKQNT